MTGPEPPPVLQETYRFRRGAFSESTRIERESDGAVWWAERPRMLAQQLAALGAGCLVIAGGVWGGILAFGSGSPLAVLCGFVAAGGGLLLAFRISPERHTVLCADEAMREAVLYLRPEGMAPFSSTHVLMDPEGRVLGRIVKARWSLSVWRVLDESGAEVARARPSATSVPALLGFLFGGLVLLVVCCVGVLIVAVMLTVHGRLVRAYRIQSGDRDLGGLERENWGGSRAKLTVLPGALSWEQAAGLGLLAARDWRGTL